MAIVREAQLEDRGSGHTPVTEGWFVVNVRDAEWWFAETRGARCPFENEYGDTPVEFDQLGINVTVLAPGQTVLYHAEANQEAFLVLSGECVLVVENEERRLRRWDFFHAPPWTEHGFAGLRDGREVPAGAAAELVSSALDVGHFRARPQSRDCTRSSPRRRLLCAPSAGSPVGLRSLGRDRRGRVRARSPRRLRIGESDQAGFGARPEVYRPTHHSGPSRKTIELAAAGMVERPESWCCSRSAARSRGPGTKQPGAPTELSGGAGATRRTTGAGHRSVPLAEGRPAPRRARASGVSHTAVSR